MRLSLRRARRPIGNSILAICLLVAQPGLASPAWEDGKAYTAMLADGGEKAIQAIKTATDNLQKAKDVLAAAQSALTGAAAVAAASAAASSAIAKAQTAVNIGRLALAEAEAGAPWVIAAAAGAVGGTLIGQGLRGLWSACWDPVCGLGFSGTIPLQYTPATPAQINLMIPQLTLLATNGATSLTAAGFTAIGPNGAAALAFLSQGAALTIDTAQGAAFAKAGNTAQVWAAAADLSTRLAGYRTAIANFAAFLPTASLTSPLASVQAALPDLTAAIAAAEAACNPGAGDDCAALTAALNSAAASFSAGIADLTAADFSSLVGGLSPYLADLSLSGFDSFLSNCAAIGVGCLPGEEVALANALISAAGTSFNIGAAIAEYDAGGDPAGRESALFAGGPINLATLLDQSATTLSSCGGPDCRWLSINPFQSPLVPEPPAIWLLITGIGLCLLIRRRGIAAGR